MRQQAGIIVYFQRRIFQLTAVKKYEYYAYNMRKVLFSVFIFQQIDRSQRANFMISLDRQMEKYEI